MTNFKRKLIFFLLLFFSPFVFSNDKELHLLSSGFVGSVAQYSSGSKPVSYGLCLSAGLAKEFYDQIDYGGFDHNDIVVDIIGCILGVEFTEDLQVNFVTNTVDDSKSIKFLYRF